MVTSSASQIGHIRRFIGMSGMAFIPTSGALNLISIYRSASRDNGFVRLLVGNELPTLRIIENAKR